MKPWKYDGETWRAESDHLLAGPDEPFVWLVEVREDGWYYVTDFIGDERKFDSLAFAKFWCHGEDARLRVLSALLFKVGNR